MKRTGIYTFWLPLLSSLICLLSFLSVYHDREGMVISGDGKGYYSYLPALIIYQDLSFSFHEEMEEKYEENVEQQKDFLNETNGKKVNKYFAGISILWLPFFLLAHFLSLISGFPADGYSALYQFFIGAASSVYLFFGSRFAILFLNRFGISLPIAALATFLFIFGSNLFHYTVYDPTLTHSINFTLIAGFLYYLHRAVSEEKKRFAYLAALLFGIIISVRVQNVLVMIPALTLILGFTPKKFLFLLKPAVILGGILISLFPLAYLMILWKKQSGSWLVDSYSGESFDLTEPHFFEMLFSFEKGWFLYTPIAALAFVGLIYLYKQSARTTLLLSLFFILLIYLFSSWWIWTYGHSFGQRVFVDYYPFLILFFGILIQSISRSRQVLVLVISLIFVGLNFMQSYQHFHGILPSLGVDRKTYFDSWLRLHPVSRYDAEKLNPQFEKTWYWVGGNDFSDSATSVEPVEINKSNAFGPSARISLHKKDQYAVKVTLKTLCEGKCKGSRLVIEADSAGTQLLYQPFYLSGYLPNGSLAENEFGITLPPGTDLLKVYPWSPDSDDPLIIEGMEITLYILLPESE